MELKNLKSQDLQTSVQEQIKMYIVESNMKNGDILPPEKEFAEKFGISRTAVREALRSLEALGIIEVRHGVGRFVREFNFEAILNNLPYSLEFNLTDFQDIMEVRLCLESYFLAKDINRFTAADYADLDALFQKLEQQVHDHSEEQELIETHVQFHCALYRHSKNQLLP